MMAGRLMNIVTPLHRATARDYAGRMADRKVECMEVARRYGRDFWDGERRFGYGGYRYDGRWKPVAEALVSEYGLGPGARILDVGCGKGFLLHELSLLLPGAQVAGFDLSAYAVANAKEEVRDRLLVADAAAPFPFPDDSFDLAISLTTLHNLTLPGLRTALSEMGRVAARKYVVVESYRSPLELFNLQCWALTAECFMRPGEWTWFFGESGFTGDYEFIFFE